MNIKIKPNIKVIENNINILINEINIKKKEIIDLKNFFKINNRDKTIREIYNEINEKQKILNKYLIKKELII